MSWLARKAGKAGVVCIRVEWHHLTLRTAFALSTFVAAAFATTVIVFAEAFDAFDAGVALIFAAVAASTLVAAAAAVFADLAAAFFAAVFIVHAFVAVVALSNSRRRTRPALCCILPAALGAALQPRAS